MAAVRAVAGADSWSLSAGIKEYFACCFSSRTEPTTPPSGAGDAKAAAAADASEGPAGGERATSRRSSTASKSDDDGSKMVDRRLEADGASVHSTGTDKAIGGGGTGHQPAGDATSSHGAGAMNIHCD